MNQEDKFSFTTNWYELWMKQSKAFFESAEKNISELFKQNEPINPEAHLKQINDWLEGMKHQWTFVQLTSEQKAYQAYWQTMTKMCSEAGDKMVQEWIKRSQENQPISDIRALYELWLNCCHEIYQKSLQAKSYQEACNHFMNAALKFWNEAASK